MARCKSCGRPIMWIRMNGGVGKPMPCDPLPVLYREDPNGSVVLVTGAGRVVRGTRDPESAKVGYTSHFATCTHAAEHRKAKRDDGEQVDLFGGRK